MASQISYIEPVERIPARRRMVLSYRPSEAEKLLLVVKGLFSSVLRLSLRLLMIICRCRGILVGLCLRARVGGERREQMGSGHARARAWVEK